MFLAAALSLARAMQSLLLAPCPAIPRAQLLFIDWVGLQELGEMHEEGWICHQTGVGSWFVCCFPTSHAHGSGFPSHPCSLVFTFGQSRGTYRAPEWQQKSAIQAYPELHSIKGSDPVCSALDSLLQWDFLFWFKVLNGLFS